MDAEEIEEGVVARGCRAEFSFDLADVAAGLVEVWCLGVGHGGNLLLD